MYNKERIPIVLYDMPSYLPRAVEQTFLDMREKQLYLKLYTTHNIGCPARRLRSTFGYNLIKLHVTRVTREKFRS